MLPSQTKGMGSRTSTITTTAGKIMIMLIIFDDVGVHEQKDTIMFFAVEVIDFLLVK